jgi:hypothetical protein
MKSRTNRVRSGSKRFFRRLAARCVILFADKAKSPISLMMYSQPVIAGGFMYTRGGDGRLHCYDLHP